jgi:putative Holliday junction resolvase
MTPAGGRVLGVDLGSRRIGLALSDPTRTVASPLEVLQRAGAHADDHRAILAVAREHDARTIVVGLPLSLSGATGPAAKGVLAEVDELRYAAGEEFAVELYDERLTTVTAERSLREARMKRDARKRVVDKDAAAVL